MKIALIFIVVLVVLLPFFAFSVSGDGVTLTSRLQMFLSFSLSAVSLLLSLLTIFLACNALSEEVRAKNIHLVVVKPIPRWQFVLGKWIGIMVLDAALLIGSGLFIYAGAWYIGRRLPARSPEKYTELDLYRVENEVFTARAGVPLTPPDLSATVENRIRQKRAEGTLSAVSDVDLERVRRDIAAQVRKEYLSIPPQEARVYLFKDLLVDRSPDQMLYVRYKGAGGSLPRDYIWRTIWLAGDPSEGTTVVRIDRRDPDDRYNTVEIPASCVSDDGILRLEIHNLDLGATLSFDDIEAGLELLYHLGGFGWNLVRGLVLIDFRLLFLAALGLLMSSFLSFPVACMGSLLVFFVAIGAGFLADAVSWESLSEDDPLWFVNIPFRGLAIGFMWLVPDLSKYNPVPTIVDGRVVTLMWLIVGAVQLVITRALVLGALACAIFSRREVAQVIV